MASAGHRGQIRSQPAHQLDALVVQLMAREQAQVLDQLVHIHRRQLGFSVSGKIQDPLHDPVQLIHLLPDDLRVRGARIVRREPQIERVVEHLHHRERIADLVRHLRRQQAERGELLVLAQLLLDVHDPLVEPGLLDRHGRQLRQGGQNADFLVREDCAAVPV